MASSDTSTAPSMPAAVRAVLREGVAIPAHPLALDEGRKLDDRRQRALARYYIAAGVGGLAVGVHTTQFAIRDVGLYEPVLRIAREEMDRADRGRPKPLVRIAGACGPTQQARREAATALDLGYHAVLLSLAALKHASEDELIAHCAAVSQQAPIVGFYLQPAAGGRLLDHGFWRRLCDLPNLVAIKIAPFNRYQTIDVVRAVAESGRDDLAVYTGNDDAIVIDLISPYRFETKKGPREVRIVGGLLGHWSVWTSTAVKILERCRIASRQPAIEAGLLRLANEVTDANAAFFDAANAFKGCIAGLHEVLRRQGILANTLCLDPKEGFGAGQVAEIDRVYRTYPHLMDDEFVKRGLQEWMG